MLWQWILMNANSGASQSSLLSVWKMAVSIVFPIFHGYGWGLIEPIGLGGLGKWQTHSMECLLIMNKCYGLLKWIVESAVRTNCKNFQRRSQCTTRTCHRPFPSSRLFGSAKRAGSRWRESRHAKNANARHPINASKWKLQWLSK